MDEPTTAFLQAIKGTNTPLESEPWLPLQRESAQDYYDFRLWLEMVPRPKVSYLVAQRNHWEERALAYDQHRAEHAPLETPEDRQRKQAAVLQVLIHTTFGQAVKLMSQLERSSSPAVSLDQLAGVADKLIKLQRLVHDQSTENVSVRGKVDYSQLSDEEIRALDALSSKVLESPQ